MPPIFLLGSVLAAAWAWNEQRSRVVAPPEGSRFGASIGGIPVGGLNLTSAQAAAWSNAYGPNLEENRDLLSTTGHRQVASFGGFGENDNNGMAFDEFRVSGTRGTHGAPVVERYLNRGGRWAWPTQAD